MVLFLLLILFSFNIGIAQASHDGDEIISHSNFMGLGVNRHPASKKIQNQPYLIELLEKLNKVDSSEKELLVNTLKDEIIKLTPEELNSIKDKQNRTVLRLAVHNAPAEIIKLLINKRQSIDLVQAGTTPLIAAIAYGNVDAFDVLAKSGANLFFRNDKGNSVLNELLKPASSLEQKEAQAKILKKLAAEKRIERIVYKEVLVNEGKSWIYDLSSHLHPALVFIKESSESDREPLLHFFKTIISAAKEKVSQDPSIIEKVEMSIAAIRDPELYPYAQILVQQYLDAGGQQSLFRPELQAKLGLEKKSDINQEKTSEPSSVEPEQAVPTEPSTDSHGAGRASKDTRSKYQILIDKLKTLGNQIVKKLFSK